MNWTLDIIEVGVIPDLPLSLYCADAPTEARLDVPCFCYLLMRADDCLMIDTGPDPTRAAAAGLKIVGDAQGAIRYALERRDIEPEHIQTVIQTHLHYDHMQNHALFSNATFLVQAVELAWANALHDDRFYVGIEEWVRDLGDRLRPVDGAGEEWQGVTLLPNGGHTPGHQSVLVTTPDGPVCLCADIVPMSFNVNGAPPMCYSTTETEAFLVGARHAGWEMIPGHDPALRSHRYYVSRPSVRR